MTRACTVAAAVLAVATLAAGLRWGAMVAGGADSYGYVSQAGSWLRGGVVVQEDIIRSSPWPGAAATWAPLGYRPSPRRPDAIVPVYAPGLPLLMAAFQFVAGFRGAFLVVPLSGALTIWLTYLLGRSVFGAPDMALCGAALVATSPVFVYQLMNAMSDVPVTAAWTLALVLALARRPLTAGFAMSAAIAIRPNLAPLAGVLFAWTLLSEARQRGMSGAASASLRLAIGVAPSVVGIGWFNSRVYESALTSGYGPTADYYALRFLTTNARLFASWIADVETPAVALGLLFFIAPGLWPAPRVSFARFLLGGSIAVVVLSYLFYQPFDVWWYLRFLLPMWPVMMLLTAGAFEAIARRWLGLRSRWAMAVAVALLSWHGLYVARDRSAFLLGRLERRYVDVARFVAAHTEPDAVIFSVQHSGSLRIYADRLTLRFDQLDPLWLDRAVAHLQSIGRRPYYVLDGQEVEAFRARFGAANRSGTLDWPPIALLGDRLAVYDPIDRRPDTSPLAIGRTRGTHILGEAPQSWPPVLRMK
jgi:hypothetical protein